MPTIHVGRMRGAPEHRCFTELLRNFIVENHLWRVSVPVPASMLERTPYAALYSRIQTRVQLQPVVERERFAQLIVHALKTAGCTHTLLADWCRCGRPSCSCIATNVSAIAGLSWTD